MKNTIELRHVELDEDYRKKWNVNKSLNDFCHLYVNGKKLSNTLYRVGGMGAKLDDNYFMLFKQVESYYCDEITTNIKGKLHLDDQSCIINSNGVEKVNFTRFNTPYLIGGQIYVMNNSYYNIETKELYADSVYSSITSKHFLFLDNPYCKDKSKRGVMKINMDDGIYEMFE